MAGEFKGGAAYDRSGQCGWQVWILGDRLWL